MAEGHAAHHGGSQARGAETRTVRKRRAIPDAAATLFLREGYLATSMDQVAAASVSKQTVYKQFADKQTLFREMVTGTVAEINDPVAEQVASLRDCTDLAARLRALARALLAQVIQPRMMQLRRLAIAEAGRFGELGRLLYERGPGRAIETLAATLETRRPRRAAVAGPAARRRALQLAGHVGPAQPGHALWRCRTDRPSRPRPLRRRPKPGIPRRLRPALTSSAIAGKIRPAPRSHPLRSPPAFSPGIRKPRGSADRGRVLADLACAIADGAGRP
jgi:AcrR family transcriptional regulator